MGSARKGLAQASGACGRGAPSGPKPLCYRPKAKGDVRGGSRVDLRLGGANEGRPSTRVDEWVFRTRLSCRSAAAGSLLTSDGRNDAGGERVARVWGGGSRRDQGSCGKGTRHFHPKAWTRAKLQQREARRGETKRWVRQGHTASETTSNRERARLRSLARAS